MTLKHLLITASVPASLILLSAQAQAQTTVGTDQDTPILTSTAGTGGTPDDVTISAGINITPAGGTAITIDSDNSVTSNGNITIEDADNAVGADLQGGNSGDFTLSSGSIQLVEDFTPTDTDSDGVVDGGFAEGTGRTGILISGASPFAGNVTVQTTASVVIEGNGSYGIRIENAGGLDGNINLQGIMNIVGSNSRGVSLEGDMVGNFINTGNITVRGDGSSAIVSSGDLTGQLNNSGTISSSGYRFVTRPTLAGRDLLNDDDRLQGASAIEVNGNISNGIFLQQVVETTTDEDGVTTDTITSTSSISLQGSAPAVLIDGQGTPISIGLVATIIDPNDADYVDAEQYAFVNQGSLSASGIYNDINATAFEVRDATLTNGINNTSSMVAATFRSGMNDAADLDTPGSTGLARVIVLGSGAIADEINNSGLIIATATEATDEIYADRDAIISAREIQAVAIDIEANANLSRIVNSSSISAIITGRNGEAVAIRDSSGTLTFLENSGSINAAGVTSDTLGEESTNFNLIAIDLSANTAGVNINQVEAVDTDLTDAFTPSDPSINGNILLGSGADTISVSAGSITGDIAFGDGADSLMISGGSSVSGAISDTDGLLTLAVSGGSTFTNTASVPVDVTSASFDSTSIYRPTLDGATGEASTITSSGDITFADGATISPILNNVISTASTTFTILDAGGTLSLGGNLGSLYGLETPFLYDADFTIDPNNANALIITLNLRDTSVLGLDTVQTASFGSAFEAFQSNTALGNAFVNISDGDTFNRAFNQLLPEFAAASRQFVLANVDGAVGAVGTHLENARKSQDKPGGVWLQEFAYFADRDLAGLSEQYRGHGFGITGGLDTAFGPFHTVGLNLGFASTEIEDVAGVDEPLDVFTFQTGAYAGYSTGKLGIDTYAGFGFNDFEATRNVEVGAFSDSAEGDWKGTHYNASLRAGYDLALGKKFWARPAVSVDYLSLSEDAYTESGPTGIALDVDERKSELGGVTAMLNFGANFQGRRTWLRPSVRVGYRNDFINDGVVTSYRFVGLNTPATIIGEEFPSSGILLGLSLAAGSPFSSFGLDLDTDIRDGFIRHTGRVVIRLVF
ncbi:MAG: autotransporter domain-containing protein [Alphaproteobacteria bacterium]